MQGTHAFNIILCTPITTFSILTFMHLSLKEQLLVFFNGVNTLMTKTDLTLSRAFIDVGNIVHSFKHRLNMNVMRKPVAVIKHTTLFPMVILQTQTTIITSCNIDTAYHDCVTNSILERQLQHFSFGIFNQYACTPLL